MPSRQENVRLLSGRFVPELETRLLDDLLQFRADDPWGRLWLLVPSLNIRRRLRERLARLGPAAWNVVPALFPDLARAVLDRPGIPALRPAGAGAALVLRGLCRPLADDPGSRFRTVAGRSGFHQTLLSTLNDLDEAGLEPGAGPGLPAGIVEILGIHRAWRERLAARGLATPAQEIARAARHAGGFDPGAPVWIYGFYDLSGAQRRLVEALFTGRPIHFYRPVAPGDTGDYSRPLLDWLAAHGVAEDGAPSPPAAAGSLTWFSAPGERREAEEVARRVAARIDAGVHPARIAVLTRSAEPYAPHLREAFRRAGLVAEFAAPEPLAATRGGRLLGQFLRAARSDHGRRELIDLLDLALADRAPALVAAWERLTAAAGIVSGRSAWNDRLDRMARGLEARGAAPAGAGADEDDTGDDATGAVPPSLSDLEAVTALRAELDRLFPLIRDIQAADRWSEMAAILDRLLDHWSDGDPERPALRSMLEQLAALDLAGEPADPGALDWVLGRLLEAGRRDAPPGGAGIFVGDVMSARGLDFDHLFLLGLTERVFPRIVTQDPILLDGDRARLAPRAAWLPPRRAAAAEELFLFRLALAMAPERTLSYARLDPATGRPRIPSAFLLAAAAEREGRPVDFDRLDRLGERVPLDRLAEAREAGRREPRAIVPASTGTPEGAVPALDAGEFDHLLLAAAVGGGRSDRAAVFRAEPEFDRLIRAEIERGRSRFTPFDGVLDSERSREILARHFRPERPWSASALERYADCPFRFFVERLLGVTELEAPEEADRVSALDRGDVAHEILREFLAGCGGPLAAPERPALRARLVDIAGRRLAAFEKEGLTGHPLLWRIDARRLTDDLLDWLDFEIRRTDALLPAAFELRFGMPPSPGQAEDPRSTAAPARLPLGGGRELLFRGRIDRVDLDPAGANARIVDYKTGRDRATGKGSPLDGGRRLQLAIYRRALDTLIPSVREGEAEYLYLAGGTTRRPLSEADYRAQAGELTRIVTVLADGIRHGRFFARPEGVQGGECRCAFASICGADREGRFERKRGDGRVADHLALDEGADGPPREEEA